MTINSIICNYMNTHKDTWREDIASMDIVIKEDETTPYALFVYGVSANFTNPIVQEARGIIIDTEKMEVVCWPFRKFGKYYETYVDTIDWSTAKVQEKLDGSIIKLWYSHIHHRWIWSTNSMIYAEHADIHALCDIPSTSEISFLNIIKSAINYQDIRDCMDTLHMEYTYIFELIGKHNQVVVDYENTVLVQTGTRNNITGEELYEDVYDGIIRPKTYDVHTLEDAIELADKLNCNSNGKTDLCELEGFVVVDDNFHRLKIKSSVYTVLHNIQRSTARSKTTLLQMLYYDNVDIVGLVKNYRHIAPELKYYDYKLTELLYELETFIDKVKFIYENMNYDRKATANIIKDHKLSYFGFKAISDPDITIHQMLSNTSHGVIGSLDKLIPNYDRASWLL